MEAPSPVPRATIVAPFAVPSRLPPEASPFPAMVPPTWVPWPLEVSELQFGASTHATPVHLADQMSFSPDQGSPQSKSGCSPSIPVSRSTAVAPSPSYSESERSGSVLRTPSVSIMALCHARLALTHVTVSCIIDSVSF